MASRSHDDQSLAKHFDKRFKTVFWISEKYLLPELVKNCLPSYKDFYIKIAPTALSDLRQNILSLLCREKVRYIEAV